MVVLGAIAQIFVCLKPDSSIIDTNEKQSYVQMEKNPRGPKIDSLRLVEVKALTKPYSVFKNGIGLTRIGKISLLIVP